MKASGLLVLAIGGALWLFLGSSVLDGIRAGEAVAGVSVAPETSNVVATPAPTPPPQVLPETYTVVSGDTLSRIATRFRISMQRLMDENGITNPDSIQVGEVLRIPQATSTPSPEP
jgi:LysM repeat protein